jgi:hypothetical protein
LGAFGGEDGFEDFPCGAGMAVVDGAVHAGVFVDRQDAVGDGVEGGALAGAGGGHVQGFAGHVVGDQGVGGVDGGALGAVHGGGVQQLDVRGDVGGGEGEGAAVAEVSHLQ